MFKYLTAIVSIYALLLAVGMIGAGFKMASADIAMELFVFASNPLLALMIGILATSLVQSSSTVTTIIVGLVAGGLPIGMAIPMVMGANIGTTITNTIVSLAYKGKEFRKAFAAATVHDFFNVLAVAIFLPLELMFGVLDNLSATMASAISFGNMDISGINFVKPITKPVIGVVKDIAPNGVFVAMLGIAIVFAAISTLNKVLKLLMSEKAKRMLEKAVGGNSIKAIGVGTGVTVLVQSSSTTTSLIIPFSGVLDLKKIYPFTLGSNIGTTITALLAATAITDGDAYLGLQIALVHFLFNFLGVLLIYFTPLRNVPLRAASAISDIGRVQALFYILLLFFILPIVLIGVFR